ncbi:MAG: hypothetical protein MK076_06535 [Flavobacteriales bacterium]|nr:hypothetical protein [Flavobacteriales bacterium]
MKQGANENFKVSFSASLLEDIIFFGITGFVIFYYTYTDGSERGLRSRIALLANNKNIDDEAAVGFLYDIIAPVLAYNELTKINLVLKEKETANGRTYIRVYCCSLPKK